MRKHKFYGRRQGRKLSGSRLSALENVLPEYMVELDDDVADDSIAPSSFFDDPQITEYWLEIGFGNGEHLAEQAKRHPHIGMIGCEPFINGVSKLLTTIEEEGIENIRIWPDDARVLMDALQKQSFQKCFVLHPDPWPKKRHHKRRFIQTETLGRFSELMLPNAELRMATDDAELANWMLEKTWRHPAFTWQAQTADDWRIRPDDWPETRYGQKQLAGQPVYFRFLKTA